MFATEAQRVYLLLVNFDHKNNRLALETNADFARSKLTTTIRRSIGYINFTVFTELDSLNFRNSVFRFYCLGRNCSHVTFSLAVYRDFRMYQEEIRREILYPINSHTLYDSRECLKETSGYAGKVFHKQFLLFKTLYF